MLNLHTWLRRQSCTLILNKFILSSGGHAFHFSTIRSTHSVYRQLGITKFVPMSITQMKRTPHTRINSVYLLKVTIESLAPSVNERVPFGCGSYESVDITETHRRSNSLASPSIPLHPIVPHSFSIS